MNQLDKIVYVSSVTDQTRFDLECKHGLRTGGFQNQKFHYLMLLGLRSMFTGEIHVVTNSIKTNKWFIPALVENIKSIVYHHHGTIIIPFVSQWLEYIKAKRIISNLLTEDSIIVCNVLDEFLTFAAIKCAKKRGVKIVGVVTDVPGFTSGAVPLSRGLKGFFLRTLLAKTIDSVKKYDAYIFLAPAMSDIVNVNSNPEIVIEGLSDSSMLCLSNELSLKHCPRTIMYAGSIHRQYGLPMFVKAFLKLKPKDYIFVIYGDGNYRHELEEICKSNPSVIYKGSTTNNEIIREQISATLLINPRPTNEEFVKYSFPSKILECMASGTPLLTTRIPSMPPEYYPHVYLFEDETEIGFAKVLGEVLKLSQNELYQKGKRAKEFILKEKRNDVQARKLLEFLNSLNS